MEQFLRCMCFCFYDSPEPAPHSTRQKSRRSAKQHRLNTKYKKQQLIKIPDQQRKNGKLKPYCCPICTNYYNKILACGDCSNCLCLHCFQNYDQKNMEKRTKMKCPFCNSTKSVFTDYELQPHSYFDTTNKGFLSKQQRIKIDNELKPAISVQLPSVPERSEQVLQINSEHIQFEVNVLSTFDYNKKMSASKDQKRINARVMKWREMLEKGIHSDQQLLIRRTRKGIPQCIRIKVWPEIVKVHRIVQKNPLTYSKVLLKDSYDVYDINLDIPRTFSFQSQQVLRDSLFNVLKALSIQFPRIGYCQGMNFLSMRLLEILDDEIVFYIIADIIHKYKSIQDNLRNPGFVNRQNEVFSKLLSDKLPKIYQQLKSHYIQPVMYTPSWFLTLYSKFLSNQKFYRFFECFMVEGYPVLFKTALALMKLKQKQFLQNSMEENLMFINDSKFYDKISDDDFVSTIFSFELTTLEVSAIEKEYTFKNKQMMKKLQESIERSYTQKLNQPRITYEWTIDDYKNVNASLLEFQ